MIVDDTSLQIISPENQNENEDKNQNKNQDRNQSKLINGTRATKVTDAANNNIENGTNNAPERGINKRGEGPKAEGLSISESADRVLAEYFNHAKKPRKGEIRRIESNSSVERSVIDEIKEYTDRKKKRNDSSKIIRRKKLRS